MRLNPELCSGFSITAAIVLLESGRVHFRSFND
jgi:hypothetical protein